MNTANDRLHAYAEAGDLVGIDAALSQGADIDDHDPLRGQTALQTAASAKKVDAFRHLLAQGADVNAPLQRGLFKAGQGGNVLDVLMQYLDAAPATLQILELALQAGADPSRSTAALHTAVARGHKPAVEVLLRYGADPSLRNGGAGLALHTVFGASINDTALVFMLARATPDLDVQDVNGRTALRYAIERGREESVCCLLALGASPQSRPHDTQLLPLRQSQDCLKWLSRSPLECAVATRETAVLAEVLQRHEDFDASHVAAALSTARRRKRGDMEAMLLSWRARRCAHEVLERDNLVALP